MKNTKKRVAALIAAMVLCLSTGLSSVMTANAAEYEPMSVEAWTHCKCGTPVVVSVKSGTRVVSSVKCTDYRHGPECYVCEVEYVDAYYITCPTCGKSEKQNEVVTGTGTLHLDR